MGETNAHDFSFTSIESEELPLNRFKGKLILVVNTASECGFTSQYFYLQALWNKYKDKGLVVIGVPSNDFAKQEPKSEAEILEFCQTKYKVDFPLTSKVHVRGDDAHPFYTWAKTKLGFLSSPKWNFHKYLIGPNGDLVEWYSPITEPMEESIVKTIEAELKKLPENIN